jgi:Zn-dependent metalloprotease
MNVVSTSLVVLLHLIPAVAMDAQTRLFTTGTPSEIQQATSIGLTHLAAWARQRGIADELRVTRVTVDSVSMAHVHVQQFHRGIPVFGGEAIAHLTPQGEPLNETDALIRDISADTSPRLTATEAVAVAAKAVDCADCPTLAMPTLWLVREGSSDYLTYRVSLRRSGPDGIGLPVVFVDAHRGDVVLRYDNVQTLAR